MLFRTEYDFTLLRGYIDGEGILHQQGVMRFAASLDEIEAIRISMARNSSKYISVILLSRVIRLEEVRCVTPEIVSAFYTADSEDGGCHSHFQERGAESYQCPLVETGKCQGNCAVSSFTQCEKQGTIKRFLQAARVFSWGE